MISNKIKTNLQKQQEEYIVKHKCTHNKLLLDGLAILDHYLDGIKYDLEITEDAVHAGHNVTPILMKTEDIHLLLEMGWYFYKEKDHWYFFA